MMFYKFILDSFSTSQLVFNKGRQCGAGRWKTICNWMSGLQNHQRLILILEGLSALSMAVPVVILGQVLFCRHCDNGVFYSSAT